MNLKRAIFSQPEMHWTWSCLETTLVATGSTQVVWEATHLISPWKVRQMPQIIVGLPLDHTLSPQCPAVLIIWGGAGHECLGSWNLLRGRWVFAVTRRMRGVRGREWRLLRRYCAWPPVYAQLLRGEIFNASTAEWLSYWLTSCSAEWVEEWTALTACLAPMPSSSEEGVETLQAWIQTVYSYTWRCIDVAVKRLAGSVSIVMVSLNIMFNKRGKRRGLMRLV